MTRDQYNYARKLKSIRKQWPSRWQDFHNGVHYGYPLCCVIRYSLSRQIFQAVHRGGKQLKPGSNYVVCGVFHKSKDEAFYSKEWYYEIEKWVKKHS